MLGQISFDMLNLRIPWNFVVVGTADIGNIELEFRFRNEVGAWDRVLESLIITEREKRRCPETTSEGAKMAEDRPLGSQMFKTWQISAK